MSETHSSAWIRTAMRRSFHCYIGALLFVAALLSSSFIHCSLAGEFDGAVSGVWVAIMFGVPLWAAIPAVAIGSLGTLVPDKGWLWICRTFVAGMVALALMLTMKETGCAPVVI